MRGSTSGPPGTVRLSFPAGSCRALRRTLLALSALLLPALGPWAGEAEFPDPVRARLLADVTNVEAGRGFTLGVLLEQDPGWHTYWAWAGDAGQATEVAWQTPPGFDVAPLRWPGPHRYQEEDLTVFGYADEVMLLAPVRTPAVLPDTVRFTAEVSWLVCREICIPGGATLSLHLEAGEAAPAHAALFDRYRARVPAPLSEADPVSWRPTVEADGGALRVAVEVTAVHEGDELPSFFPLPGGDTSLDVGALVEQGPKRTRSELRIEPYPGKPLPGELAGVIAFPGAGGEGRFRTIRFDLRESGIDLLDAEFGAPGGASSLWRYLLMAIVGGLILNLMPCVLPVISLKALSLVSQGGEEPRRVRQLGLAFSAGVVLTFLVLAALVTALKAGGEQIGWGFQFQSPGFVLFLTGLVFVLALSLFGLVTVRLPGSVGALGAAAQGEGLGHSFFNGVLATVLATPCTAPFLGTALGFAFSQPAPVVFAVFAAIGAGLCLPYLALAWQPRWIRFLPRPGAWMERFKQAMGFLLMATVLWLLWVVGKQLGMEAVVWTCAFLLSLALGAWIVGTWIDLRTSTIRRRAAWAFSLLIALGGYSFFLHPLLASPATSGAALETEGWEEFDVQRLESLLTQDRHLFIDFTAEWCWTCKVNERLVLSDPDVRDRFEELDVVLVKADWTNRNPEITRMLRAFGRSGVPLYVIFPAGRPGEPIVLPEVITKGIVLEGLERARGG